METHRLWSSSLWASTFVLSVAVGSARAQSPANSGQPQFRTVEQTARNDVPGAVQAAHPVQQALDYAQASLARAQEVRDCAFTFVKREEIDGQLSEHEAIYMKIRNEPFSVYAYTLGPKQPKGQEAIYVAGRNNGNAVVHVVGLRHKLVGMLTMPPEAPEMMEGNRYPITSAGFVNMLAKVSQLYQLEMTEGVSDVQIIPGAKVDGRDSTCVQVSHPNPGRNFYFQTTRMFYDTQTGLPTRWEAYAFAAPGQPPRLVEEYTYRNVQLNVGLTDADFDPNNAQYGFK